MTHVLENPFDFEGKKISMEHWDSPADLLQAEAFMIAERYIRSLTNDPERRVLAIGQMQGFLAALSVVSPAEVFNRYLEQMKTLYGPEAETQTFLDHLSPLE